MQDIKWALARGYPTKLRYKLYERQGNSLQALGRFTEATEAYGKTLNLLDQSELPADKKNTIRQIVKKIEEFCREKTDDVAKGKTKKAQKDDVNFIPDPDSLYPNLSPTCEVRSSPEKGLYVVAKETLKPGDVIIKENPYAWSVDPEYKHTYCHHCMSRFVFFFCSLQILIFFWLIWNKCTCVIMNCPSLLSLEISCSKMTSFEHFLFSRFTTAIPCPGCNVALFCNEQCMVASNKYHKYECPCLSLLMEDSIGLYMLTAQCLVVIVSGASKMISLQTAQTPVPRYGDYSVRYWNKPN